MFSLTIIDEEQQHCMEPKTVNQTESDGRTFGTEIYNVKTSKSGNELYNRNGRGTLVHNGIKRDIPKARRGSVATEKMASIRVEQEAFARKGQNTESSIPRVGRGNVAAERMASIKAQQEAFAQKGRPREEANTRKIGRGNVAAEKMAAIKAQQEAFSMKGRPKVEVNTWKAGKGNLAEKKIASIKAHKEAFSRRGIKAENPKSIKYSGKAGLERNNFSGSNEESIRKGKQYSRLSSNTEEYARERDNLQQNVFLTEDERKRVSDLEGVESKVDESYDSDEENDIFKVQLAEFSKKAKLREDPKEEEEDVKSFRNNTMHSMTRNSGKVESNNIISGRKSYRFSDEYGKSERGELEDAVQVERIISSDTTEASEVYVGVEKNTKFKVGNVAAQRIAMIKAQQEAFAQKGRRRVEDIPKVGRGNVAAEKMAAIKSQQEAFARKGRKGEGYVFKVDKDNVVQKHDQYPCRNSERKLYSEESRIQPNRKNVSNKCQDMDMNLTQRSSSNAEIKMSNLKSRIHQKISVRNRMSGKHIFRPYMDKPSAAEMHRQRIAQDFHRAPVENEKSQKIAGIKARIKARKEAGARLEERVGKFDAKAARSVTHTGENSVSNPRYEETFSGKDQKSEEYKDNGSELLDYQIVPAQYQQEEFSSKYKHDDSSMSESSTTFTRKRPNSKEIPSDESNMSDDLKVYESFKGRRETKLVKKSRKTKSTRSPGPDTAEEILGETRDDEDEVRSHVSLRTAVQKRRQEFEEKQREERLNKDYKTFQKVRWKTGNSHGRFMKKVKDSRGVVQKKSLSDLP